jgi:hypothetical protein
MILQLFEIHIELENHEPLTWLRYAVDEAAAIRSALAAVSAGYPGGAKLDVQPHVTHTPGQDPRYCALCGHWVGTPERVLAEAQS